MSTAAAMTRIYNALCAGAGGSAYELAEQCFCVRRHAQLCLANLREVGLAHVARWRRQTGEGARGRPQVAVWAYGPGPDAPRPPRMTAKQSRNLRARRLQAKYGADTASTILRSRREGGASVLMLDGEVVYRRWVSRGRRAA